ncbi:VOC family protein [Ilumatobacter coccineus]|uniref:Extradiol dioxygenase n=1 Tax=Ilumatobacter coccineus (strain NBRC 103263 / KCTC 29153 / YM16-304) TaxID=1313172 RepID=A0A6C7EF77_ILUCY|nr:VOC family protein [Ilumatobacter coccineus]BAN03685.1 extradiol dioxygenase [Ilumatobacter coccineus YM16-304]
MDIRGLGYIGITAEDVDEWRPYGEMLGAAVADDRAGLRLRFDERPYRVLVGAGADGLAFAGWELPDSAALESAAAQLTAAGLTIDRGSVEECEHRLVRGLLRVTDPGGFVLELFHGPILDHRRFVSPAGISGFTMGAHGMGHIVLGTPALDASISFYTSVLGFQISDYWRPGDEDVVFLRCNQRHHSLALVPAPEPALYHFMVEARTLDDVGYTLDRHIDAGTPISMTLGKHTNDHMVSFYSRSPAGFDVEFGCGGLLVDDATWTVTQITEPSFWGHRSPTA